VKAGHLGEVQIRPLNRVQLRLAEQGANAAAAAGDDRDAAMIGQLLHRALVDPELKRRLGVGCLGLGERPEDPVQPLTQKDGEMMVVLAREIAAVSGVGRR
jgi:hypothetical protein